MANEYLERNAAARKQLGKKGLKKRVKQLPTAVGEVAAYISEGPKETRGKYQELGVSRYKLGNVAAKLFAAGDKRAAAVQARVNAKFSGGLPPTTSSGMYSSYGQEAREALRNQSTSVFPRQNPFSGNTQTALINEIKQSLRSIQKQDMARGTKFILKNPPKRGR